MIATRLSVHASRQAQRRGITFDTIDLILKNADRSQKLAGKARALWISRRGRDRLAHAGLPPSEVDRSNGVRLVLDMRDDVIVTVEHATARRCWA
jgi:hypothetical protein